MMPMLASCVLGQALPSMTMEPLTRHIFALYAGGSGDHNSLHTDIDFAREAGQLPDVIGHGMLSMALAGRYLTELAPIEALRSFSVRFVGMTQVGDVLTCRSTVDALSEEEGARRIGIGLRMDRRDGTVILTGQALIAIPAP